MVDSHRELIKGKGEEDKGGRIISAEGGEED